MRRRLLLWASAVAASAVLVGCAAPKVDDYRLERPVFDLTTYFNGRVDARGIFQDRSGRIVKRFTVVMDCQWTGDQGVLDERFSYSDGSTQRRVWHLTRHPGGRYTGTADDVVGQAEGTSAGNAFHWAYTLKLPVDGKVYDVQLDDWMYLVEDRVMLNRATMAKFGVRLGDLTLSFSKP